MKGNSPKVHVLNPTATPRYDEFGIDYIFQPDQTKNPGTFGFEVDDKGKRVRSGDGKIKLIKVSDAKASNITVMPGGWHETTWKSEAARAAKGLVGLEIVETKAENLVRENDRLKKEAASVQREKAQLTELAAALGELEGSAAVGTDIAKGIAAIKGRLASFISPAKK
jgi:hypothetical protein